MAVCSGATSTDLFFKNPERDRDYPPSVPAACGGGGAGLVVMGRTHGPEMERAVLDS